MSLKIEKKVHFESRLIEFGYIDDNGNWIEASHEDDSCLADLNASPELIKAIEESFITMRDAIVDDLTELYNLIEKVASP